MMMQYTGFTVTPLLGALISQLRGTGEAEWGMLSSSAFTIPAYVLLALALVGIALLQFAFTNAPPKVALLTAPETPTPGANVEMFSAAAYNTSPIASSVSSADTESGLRSPTNAEAARLQREDASTPLAGGGHHSSSSSSSSSSNGGICSSSSDKGNGERPLLIALLLLNVLIKGGMSCHETLGTQVSHC
jgi:hypothetical protein